MPNIHFILSIGRSQTAWLHKILNDNDTICYHEPISNYMIQHHVSPTMAYKHILNSVNKLKTYKHVVIIDGNAIYSRPQKQYNTVYIHRDYMAVYNSYKNINIDYGTSGQINLRLLQDTIINSNIPTIQYPLNIDSLGLLYTMLFDDTKQVPSYAYDMLQIKVDYYNN